MNNGTNGRSASRSSNPALRNMNGILDAGRASAAAPSAAQLQQMYDQPAYQAPPTERFLTIDDVVAKTATLLGLTVVAGAITAFAVGVGGPGLNAQAAYTTAIIGAIAGFILALVVIFKRSMNPALISAYAVAEGVFLGGITAVVETLYPGIALQAVVGTLGVFGGMLVVYKTGAIKVTPRFTKMIIGAMVGVVLLMVVNLVMYMFGGSLGIRASMFGGEVGTLAIVFSIVCIAIAAFSFLLDFEAIDQAIKAGAPAKTAWYFSFGLMVTLVWLYLEILRLLSYLQRD